ncbi:unnamed protein product [Arctogadus glacialis]
MYLFPILRQDEMEMSCIRIQSHIYFILLDPLQFTITQLLHLHVQCLLQLIQGSPQDEVPDQQNQNSGLVLVVDHAEDKKYGSRQTVAARMLAVVNHVDKLYRSLGTRMMLVGLEIWTYGDQMEVTGDPHTGDAHTGDAHTGTPHTGDPHTGHRGPPTEDPAPVDGPLRLNEAHLGAQAPPLQGGGQHMAVSPSLLVPPEH